VPAEKSPRRHRRLDRPRERVLEVAWELLIERGLADLTLAELGRRVDTSAGHLLYYFGSKDGLLLEVLRWSEAQLWARWEESRAEEAPFAERFDLFCRSSCRTAWGTRGGWSGSRSGPGSCVPRSCAASYEELDQVWRDELARLLTDAAASRTPPRLSAADLRAARRTQRSPSHSARRTSASTAALAHARGCCCPRTPDTRTCATRGAPAHDPGNAHVARWPRPCSCGALVRTEGGREIWTHGLAPGVTWPTLDPCLNHVQSSTVSRAMEDAGRDRSARRGLDGLAVRSYTLGDTAADAERPAPPGLRSPTPSWSSSRCTCSCRPPSACRRARGSTPRQAARSSRSTTPGTATSGRRSCSAPTRRAGNARRGQLGLQRLGPAGLGLLGVRRGRQRGRHRGLGRRVRIDSPLVNEGGGIHTDGAGTFLVTETVQLDPGRNPGWTKADVEAELARTVGARKVIWLPRGPDPRQRALRHSRARRHRRHVRRPRRRPRARAARPEAHPDARVSAAS
jgi:AcrR family transcriptional regulator